MKVRTASVVLAAAAMAACPVSYASANVIGYTFETLNGDGSAQNVLNVDPTVGKGNFNANTGTSQQSNAQARFGTYSAYIAGDKANNLTSANMAMYANFAPTQTLTVMAHVDSVSTNWASEFVIIENNTGTNSSDMLDAPGQYRLAADRSTGRVWLDLYDATASSVPNDGYGSGNGKIDVLATPTGVFSAGQWAHIAFTFDHGVATIYVNGTAQASHDYSATLSSISATSGAANYPLIGDSNDGSRYLNGYLDDFYFNDEAALSASDIAFYSTHTITEPVPEPATLGALALGGLLLIRRRRS